MKITDFIAQRTNELVSTSRQIGDFRVFDFNHIPPEPLMRQEAGRVIDACLRYITTGIPNHLLVFGSRGSGKTLLVRYVGQLLSEQKQARVLYVNCRQHNTSFKILAHLLGVQPRGCSLDELWHRFMISHTGRIILVLDEVDLISDKDRHKEILYLVSRCSKAYMAVLLSNHPRFLSTLDESVRSSLQPETILFRNYDAHQILEILADRARRGLRQWEESLLAEIAARTFRETNSDVRVAIKTLYYAAIENSRDIDQLFQRARRDLTTDVLSDLNERSLLMMRAATQAHEPFVKDVYLRYRRLSQELHEEPFSYVYFYNNLAYLQSVGLIVLLSTKVGRTYTNRIQILFDPQLLETIWNSRCG